MLVDEKLMLSLKQDASSGLSLMRPCVYRVGVMRANMGCTVLGSGSYIRYLDDLPFPVDGEYLHLVLIPAVQ